MWGHCPHLFATTQYSAGHLKPAHIPKQCIHFNISIVIPQNTCDGKLVRKFEQHIELHQLFCLQEPIQFNYRAGSDSSAYCCMVALKDQWRTCMTIGCTVLYKGCNSVHKSTVKHWNFEENSPVQRELLNFSLCRSQIVLSGRRVYHCQRS